MFRNKKMLPEIIEIHALLVVNGSREEEKNRSDHK